MGNTDWDFVGNIPVRTELTVLTADKPPDEIEDLLREIHEEPKGIGFTIKERVGVGYYNPRRLAKLKIDR
jgi:hypothetical protein